MKQRLINCDFLNAGGFTDKIPNKAKLLYFYMFINADDRGFVDNTFTLIETLEKNDKEFRNEINLSLLNNDYPSALYDLIGRGYLYEFRDNHDNKVHLIRHWFVHNKYRKGLWTNYGSFLKQVEIVDGKYVLKDSIKENYKLNEDKLNENNTNEIKVNEDKEHIDLLEDDDEEPKLEDFLRAKGVSRVSELTADQINEWINICYGKKEN